MPVMAKVIPSNASRQCNFMKVSIILVISFFCILVMRELFPSSSQYSSEGIGEEHSIGQFNSFRGLTGRFIRATTWNIAAINNNPFEYWITSDSNDYENLMQKVANFINNPAEKDIPVSSVFTDEMFDDLYNELKSHSISGYNETREIWHKDFKNRKIITGFIKDSSLGKKRLISMPDRVTNTIHTINLKNVEDREDLVVMRPTVVNCYQQKLNTVNDWWKDWRQFMFHSPIGMKKKVTTASGESKETVQTTNVFQLVPKIEKAKYPSITSEEEKIAIPLGILSLAIFDSILVHMMNSLSQNQVTSWQTLRNQICQQCNFQKNQQILNILLNSYNDSNVVFLQEVAGTFFAAYQQLQHQQSKKLDADTERFRAFLSSYEIVSSSLMDYDRDQNSFILLKKDQFVEIKEVTPQVLTILNEMYKEKNSKNPVVNGDLLVLTAIDRRDNNRYLFASFHGDTNG
jgi:hypothetical protein